jgi:hypothetical protein
VLPANADRIRAMLAGEELVLDVGGWADPFERADWVLDLMPYETRGLYAHPSADPGADLGPERFSSETWVCRDICDREPWPFADLQFDFAVCSHTLEDVRDPVWVCSELVRVARAGYIEVPSREEEQSRGVHGPWVGWTHHRWICDIGENRIEFVAKPHLIHYKPGLSFPEGFAAGLSDAERISSLFWEGRFEFRERIFTEGAELEEWLEAPVRSRGSWGSDLNPGRRGGWRRWLSRSWRSRS